MRRFAMLLFVLSTACSQPAGEALSTSGPAGEQPVQRPDPTGVERLAGSSRIETAVAVSHSSWEQATTVVLASAADFPDALGAGAVAAAHGAPLLLTDPAELPEPVMRELERLGAEEVLVVGGNAAVHATVEDQLRGMGVAVRRLAGADRYATAAQAAAHAYGSGAIVLASGQTFADALAAGPRPVLLTAPDHLPATTADALRDLGVEEVVITGGHAAVAAAVEDEVRALGLDVRRVAGADRYATALALLEETLAARTDPLPLVVTGGEGFADALAAGPLAARLGAGLALTPPARLTDELDGLLRRADVPGILLLGGAAATSAHVEAELSAALEAALRPLATVTTPDGFSGTATELPADVRERMLGVSWQEGCPVGLDGLAYLDLNHHDFQGTVTDGELVVALDVAADVLEVLAAVFDAGFPIERMVLVDDYGADDRASMDANNTSAFNCRPVEGGSRWSEHAYGTAIDINPVQNPYRRGSTVLPEAGRAFLDRADVRPGMIVRAGPVTDAFARAGWGWGGDWASLDDWMHFSTTGR